MDHPGQRQHDESAGSYRLAVLIPCYNEEKTVGKVIRDFRSHVPAAEIYVFDNNSTDRTVEEARRAGAIVRRETRQGKGFVVHTMFKEVDADVYVMVDGDDTYPADKVHELIRPVVTGAADVVIGSRLQAGPSRGFKLLNFVGNHLYLVLLNSLFRVQLTDLLSGYRAISRRVVKSVPFLSRGFEIETELTIKCLSRGYRIIEVPVSLSPRPEGSQSKIRIVRDGLLILETLFALVRDYKPLTGFGLLGIALLGCGLIPGVIVIKEFLSTGQILHLPSAVLAVGLVLAGLIVQFSGLVLHVVVRRFQELDHQMLELLEYHMAQRPKDDTTKPSSDT